MTCVNAAPGYPRSLVLQHFSSGHAQTHVAERYTKLLQDRDYRLEWADTFRRLQLAYVAYFSHSEKQVTFFKIWWTRGDSNPRPPRCEQWGK
jgi:hypothetical protein